MLTAEGNNSLANQFGFTDPDKLQKQLTETFQFINILKQNSDPIPSDSKLLLTELDKRTSALLDVLNMIGPLELRLTGEAALIHQLQDELPRLGISAQLGASMIKKGKRPSNPLEWNLVTRLADIWADQFGEYPKCYHDLHDKYKDNVYKGDFLLFVDQCAELVDIDPIAHRNIKDILSARKNAISKKT